MAVKKFLQNGAGGGLDATFQQVDAGDVSNLPAAASKTDEQTGTSTTVYTSPGQQQSHDSAAKAWVAFDNTGAILASYNVTSVTKNGTGDFTVNFTTPFASANYCALITARGSSGKNGWGQITHGTAPTASALRIGFVSDDPPTAPIVFDPDSGHVVCYGRQ
jgi:hypothetical protein